MLAIKGGDEQGWELRTPGRMLSSKSGAELRHESAAEAGSVE